MDIPDAFSHPIHRRRALGAGGTACYPVCVRSLAGLAVVFFGLVGGTSAATPGLIGILAQELSRNFEVLRQKASEKPYFLSYGARDEDSTVVSASLGALTSSGERRARVFDVSLRVGTPKLDNYHQIGGDRPQFAFGGILPAEDNAPAIQRQLWRITDQAYRAASSRYIKLSTDAKVARSSAGEPDDFSGEDPVVFDGVTPPLDVPLAKWQNRARKLSLRFARYPGVTNSSVTISATREVKYLVTTEGTRLRHGRIFIRLAVSANSRTVDGMELNTGQTFEGGGLSELPADATVEAAVDRAGRELEALKIAPVMEPYAGPAILSGYASAVFFHEIFGHRIEGHRQKDETEGQTFTKAIGKPVLPDFLSVLFDPTRQSAFGHNLFGSYAYDDEGVKARPVTVVEHGILKSFLLTRSPIRDFPKSNGHGRKQIGRDAVSRQSNLIVESSRTVPDAKLRQMLIAEIRRQSKPYGLYFQQVTGGFTQTRRQGLQAFTVIPLVVYRVYPDGRPDQLVRGADIVGTPLASFGRILAASDHLEVFNGYCGAESGSIPVSAASPALLVSEIEVQKKATSEERSPILPRPPLPDGGGR